MGGVSFNPHEFIAHPTTIYCAAAKTDFFKLYQKMTCTRGTFHSGFLPKFGKKGVIWGAYVIQNSKKKCVKTWFSVMKNSIFDHLFRSFKRNVGINFKYLQIKFIKLYFLRRHSLKTKFFVRFVYHRRLFYCLFNEKVFSSRKN